MCSAKLNNPQKHSITEMDIYTKEIESITNTECINVVFLHALCICVCGCLYVTVWDGDTVKHYRITQLDGGEFFIFRGTAFQTFFVFRHTMFQTLQKLVEHFSKDADGLCVNLRKSCVQVRCRDFAECGLMWLGKQVHINGPFLCLY